MATSLMPQLSYIVDASGGTLAGVMLRWRIEVRRGIMEAERSSFISHWKDLNDFILPRRGRFFWTDVNKGDRRTARIINETATLAARTCAAGMSSGLTSPAKPWFRLGLPDPDLMEISDIKAWLDECTKRMLAVLAATNFYNATPIAYGDLATFGTHAVFMKEDDEDVVRFYPFPIGMYSVGNDHKNRVRVFIRTFRVTILQLVEEWGRIDPTTGKTDWQRGEPSRVSHTVQNLYDRGIYDVWVDLVHAIFANYAYDGEKIEAQHKRYRSIYYEIGTPNNTYSGDNAKTFGLLADEGFDEFPVLCLRWETNAEDAYGTNCPGMTALSGIKQLQTMEKRIAQAAEKQVNPPMVGPSVLRQAKTSILPGDITYLDVREGMKGFEPAHEVKFELAEAGQLVEKIEARIERAFFADLFLMLTDLDRKQITATEIAERKEEKLLALGPVLEQLNQDFLDPLIERLFNIMMRRRLLPPPPRQMRGQVIKIEYISILHQAQKMAMLQYLERFASFVAQLSQVNPDVLDAVDFDEMVTQYADMTGIPSKIVKAMDVIQQIREQKQKQMQQAQAAQNAESMAGAANKLAGADMSGDNALTRLFGRQTARQTLSQTGQPAANPALASSPSQ